MYLLVTKVTVSSQQNEENKNLHAQNNKIVFTPERGTTKKCGSIKESSGFTIFLCVCFAQPMVIQHF